MTSKKKILIVGGVAGGASAAARLRRLDEFADITLIERGQDVSFANCGLPYHIGGEIVDRSKLAVQTPGSLERQLAIKVKTNTEATAIHREEKMLEVRDSSGKTEQLAYDKLILSPGAQPLRPDLPGIDLPGIYTLRNLQDMDRIKAATEEAQQVLVIGAGFIGLEMAEQLIKLGKQVRLIELADQVLPQLDPEMTKPVKQELIRNGVELILSDGIKSFAAKQNSIGILAELESGKQLEGDLVLLSIGVRPESGLAKSAGLELGARGHVKTNAYMQTSDPDIYAVGDACENLDPILAGPSTVPLGGPANRQGRCAADHIVLGEKAQPYPGSIGTAIVRVFDVTAGITGHSEKRLNQLGCEYQKTTVNGFNHAGYFPGATNLTVKILWDPASGQLLGGQVNGHEGVDKRLDVLATAIKGRLTIEDLAQLELAYAPPFGAARDPINTAGFSAMNIRDGLYEPVFELSAADNTQLLDVRPAETAKLKPIPDSVNIPYAELRNRLDELEKSKPITTVCTMGKTSYFASRILKQHGYSAQSHVGGWTVAAPIQKSEKIHSSTESGHKAPVTAANHMVTKLDATGLACPGPIMRAREAALTLSEGGILEVKSSDAGFLTDFPAFCNANGYECLGVTSEKGITTGSLRKNRDSLSQLSLSSAAVDSNGTTIVVFSGELDKAMAAFVIANGALAMGGKATLFFTFWGLNVLRKNPSPAVQGKTFMDKLFGWMLPKGPGKLPLSNMHMAGMGTTMMKSRMASKKLPNLPDLMESAIKGDTRLVACTMSMEAMGIRQEELIDGVELGGVAEFLGAASKTGTNLFI